MEQKDISPKFEMPDPGMDLPSCNAGYEPWWLIIPEKDGPDWSPVGYIDKEEQDHN